MSSNRNVIDATRTDRWMIHAILPARTLASVESNIIGVIAGRANLYFTNDFAIAASYVGSQDLVEDKLERQITAHSTLVNDLHRVADVLPFRFGVVVSSSEIVSTAQTKRIGYRYCLEQIAGMTELNLRWAVNDSSVDTSNHQPSIRGGSCSNGFEYLKSKLAKKQIGSQIDRELVHCGESFCRLFPSESIQWKSSTGRLKVKGRCSESDCYVIARLDLLVRKEVAESIMKAASSLLLRSEKPTVASGPWPPYSFIESEKNISHPQQMQRCAITFPKEAVS